MNHTAPHYLLFTQAKDSVDATVSGGRWKFVLEEIGTKFRLEEAEFEPGVVGERLQLLVVVRGLEAIEQTARVTLITPSKYVGRGLRMHLSKWKHNHWMWERFGQQTLIKHHDLWQRIEHARGIHQIECRVWQFDPPQESPEPSPSASEYRFDEAHNPIRSPKGTSIRSGLRVDKRKSAGNRIVLADRRRENHSFQYQQNMSPVGLRIKPVGQGRAFGYAAN